MRFQFGLALSATWPCANLHPMRSRARSSSLFGSYRGCCGSGSGGWWGYCCSGSCWLFAVRVRVSRQRQPTPNTTVSNTRYVTRLCNAAVKRSQHAQKLLPIWLFIYFDLCGKSTIGFAGQSACALSNNTFDLWQWTSAGFVVGCVYVGLPWSRLWLQLPTWLLLWFENRCFEIFHFCLNVCVFFLNIIAAIVIACFTKNFHYLFLFLCLCLFIVFCYSNLSTSMLQLCYSVVVVIVAVNNFHQLFIVVENLATLSFIALLSSVQQCCMLLLLMRDIRLIIYRTMDSKIVVCFESTAKLSNPCSNV